MGRPAKPAGERVRDISPTGVRLPPSLRDALTRYATINGRSLAQEITQRLQASVSEAAVQRTLSEATVVSTAEKMPGLAYSQTDMHRQLGALFDALTPDKQLALLTLLRR
jgi:hypothetical protein